MDKKNTIIGILILALIATIYFAFQNIQPTKTENGASNSSAISAIPPSQALKVAFDESSQHSAMADIAELSCFPTSRFDCSLEGCTPAAPSTYYFVDYGTESGTYFRCDAEGCDSYPVNVNFSGSFTQFIPSLGQAMLFKVANDDPLVNKGEFVDVATLGTMIIVSFGKCNTSK